jgi:hypothetical protein
LDCTDPEVWVGRIVAKGDRFASPYVSRKTVEYRISFRQLTSLAIFAQSYRHALLLGEITNPEDILEPFPKTGKVTEWEGGKVPFTLVEPIYRLAREMGLRPWAPWDENSLVYAWTLSPVLWGWHYAAPIYVVAAADNKNEPAEIKGEPAFRQGSMLFIPATDENRPFGPFFVEPWHVADGDNLRESDISWFYNHYAIRPDATLAPDVILVKQKSVDPIGVLHNGVRYACVPIRGPAIIWAQDHEPITLPEGEFFALHPLVVD